MKALTAIFFVAIMVASSFFVIPLTSATPSSSQSNTATLSFSNITGYQNDGTATSGSTTVTAKMGVYQTVTLDSSSTWSSTTIGTTTYWTQSFSLGDFQFATNGNMEFSFAFRYVYGIGASSTEVWTNITYEGAAYDATHTYSSSAYSGGFWAHDSVEFNPGYLSDQYGSASISVTTFTTGKINPVANFVTQTTGYGTYSTSSTEPTNLGPSNFLTGWTFSGATHSFSWTNPANAQSLQFYYSSPYPLEALVSSTTSSQAKSNTMTFGTAAPTSAKLEDIDTSNIPGSVSSFTVSWSTPNVVVSASTTQSSTTASGTITENQNWWNGTYSFTVTPPSGFLNGATVNGATWSTDYSLRVSNLLVSGYDQNAPINDFYYSGTYSGSFTSLASSVHYESFQKNTVQVNSQKTITVNTANILNFDPSVTQTYAQFSGTGSTATLSMLTSEQVSGEKETVEIWWSSTQAQPDIHTGVTAGELSYSHSYTTTGDYQITVKVINQPNAPSSDALSTISTTSYVVGINPTPSPSPLTVLYTDEKAYFNFTETNLAITSAIATVNGNAVEVTGTGKSYWVTSTLFGQVVISIQWTATTTTGFSQSFIYEYGAPLVPGLNDSFVSTVFGSTPTYTYPISLTNVPNLPEAGKIPTTITNSQSTATGTYQQLIDFPTSQYASGLNSAFSDVYFSYSNGTSIPAWIESNASNTYSSTPIWLKLYNIPANSAITIYANINPNKDFFGNATANIGEAPQLSSTYGEYDNGKNVFTVYDNFAGTSLNATLWTALTGKGSPSITVSNGLTLTNPLSSAIAVLSNKAYSYPLIAEDYITGWTTSGAPELYGAGEATQNVFENSHTIGSQYFVAYATNTAVKLGVGYEDSSGAEASVAGSTGSTPFTAKNNIGGIEWAATGTQYGWINDAIGSNYASLTDTTNTIANYYLVVASTRSGSGGSGSISLDWFRARVPVPNNIMPTVSFGSIQYTSNSGSTQYFQQQITISKPGNYGINNESNNIALVSTYGVPYYAWVQSFSSSDLVLWVKLPYSSSSTLTIYLEVFEEFRNIMSVSNYIGEAPQLSTAYAEYDNGIHVFPYYDNFSTLHSQYYQNINLGNSTFHHGLTMTGQYYWIGAVSAGATVGYTYISVYHSGYAQQLWTSGSNFSSSSIQYGSEMNAVGMYEFTQYSTYQYFTPIETQTSPVDLTMAYSFLINTSAMATATLGTGLVFQANGTQISHLHYSVVSSNIYNSTLSSFTYNIYDSYSSDYLTVYYNDSWTFQYASPSPFRIGHGIGGDFLTWADISGVGTITASFLQPSPLINTPSFITIEPEMNNNSVSLTGIHLVADYYPYDSPTQSVVTSYGLSIQVPFAAKASFYLYNEWNQIVGSLLNVQINQQDGTLTMPVSVATLAFDFTNSTMTTVTLTANGLSYSFYGSATVASGYSYVWLTQVYNLYEGKNVNYSGIVDITSQEQTLVISTNAPPSSLIVTVNGYAQSNQGELGVAGTPPIRLYIDGQLETPGSTYIGFVGSTYEITVRDVLGQLLYESNLTLETTVITDQVNINKPSWQWSIQNQEQVSSTSPLATEYVNLNINGTNTWYNFTDQVGQQSILYLKQGDYNLNVYDNATFDTSFSLTQNANYVIFGQSLLTYQEFENKINQILNNTQGIELQTIQMVSTVVPGQQVSYELHAFFTNGTQMSHSQLENSSLILQVTNGSATVPIGSTFQISETDIFLNFSAPVAGEYTISIGIIYDSQAGRTSYPLVVQSITIVSSGMQITATGPSQGIVNHVYNYTISVEYGNGTSLNLQDTKSVYDNTTFTIYNGIDPVQKVQLISYGKGIILFNALFNASGGYSIYIQSHADLSGYASASTLIPVEIYAASELPIQISFSGPTNALLDASQTFTETIFGQSINASTLSTAYNSTYVTIYEGSTFILTLYPTSHSLNNVFFSYTFTSAGNYTAIVTLNIRDQSLSGSVSFPVSSIKKISSGMSMSGTGPSQVILDEVNNYTLSIDYANGTAMNLKDTYSVYKNLTIEIYTGIDPVQKVTLLNYYAGVITFNVLFNQTGSFTLYAVSHTNLNGFAESTALIPVTVVMPTVTSNNMQMSISGTSSGNTGGKYLYLITVSFLNNTLLNLKETGWVYANLTVDIINGSSTYVKSSYVAGLMYVYVTFNKQDDYQVFVSSHAGIPNSASASAILSVIIETPSQAISVELTGPNNGLENTPLTFTETIFGQNITATTISTAYSNSYITIYDAGTYVATIYPSSYSSDNIFFSYTFTSAGNYTATLTLNIRGLTLASSVMFPVSQPVKISVGMSMSGTGPSQVILDSINNYTLAVSYANGTAMSLADTHGIFLNLTIEVYNGIDPAQYVTPLNYYKGVITFDALLNKTGSFTLYAISHANIQGSYVEGSTLIPVTVVSPSPIINNMQLILAGPTSGNSGNTYAYTILVEFTNGTSFSLAETHWIYANLTAELLNGTGVVTLEGYTAGVINFQVSYSSEGNYLVYVKSHAKIPESASASAILSVIIEPVAPPSISIQLTGPSDVITGTSITFIETVFGQDIKYAYMDNYFNNTQLSIYNGVSLLHTYTPTSFSSNNIFFTVTLTTSGNYTASVILNANSYLYSSSLSFQESQPVKISDGMSMSGTGPSQVTLDTTNNFTLSIDYANGTAMSLKDTGYIFSNLTVEIYTGIDPIQKVTLLNYYAGVITFNVLFNKTGSFTLYAISHANLNGFAESTALIPVTVNAPVATSYNMNMKISGISSGYTNITYLYLISVTYLNGSSLNSAYTLAVYNHLKVAVINGTSNYKKNGYSAGLIYLYVTFSKQDDYQIYVSSYAMIPNNASASSVISSMIEYKAPPTVSVKLTAPAQTLVDSTLTFTETIFGQGIDKASMWYYLNNTQLSIYNGKSLVTTLIPTSFSSNNIFFVTSFASAGNYSAVVILNAEGSLQSASMSFEISNPVKISEGMSMSGAGTSSTLVDQWNNYTLSVDYSNGTPMNLKDTESVFNNLTLEIFNGIDPVQQATKLNYYSGVITFEAVFTLSGTFTVYAISHLDLTGNLAEASALIATTVTYPVAVQNNMKISISGPQTGYVQDSYLYVLTLSYANNSIMSLKDTQRALANLTVTVINGTSTYHDSITSAGIIYLYVTFTTEDDYMIYVSTSLKMPNLASGSATESVQIQNAPQNQVSVELTGQSQIINGNSATFIETVFGQGITTTTMANYYANTQLSIYKGSSLIQTITPVSYTSNNIFFSYTFTSTGNYSVVVILNANGTLQSSSFACEIVNPVKISEGMSMNGVGPSATLVDQWNNYTLSIDYSNGTAMSLKDTKWVFDNLTLVIYDGIDPVQKAVKLNYYAGVITFEALFNASGTFTVYAMSHVTLIGSFAEASAMIATVASYPVVTQNNMQLKISGPQSGYVNSTYLFVLSLSYANNSIMSLQDTQRAFANLSVNIINGTSTDHAVLEGKGIIYLYVTFTKQDDYEVYASTSLQLPNSASASSIQGIIISDIPENQISVQLTGPPEIIYGNPAIFTETVFGQGIDKASMWYYYNNTQLTVYNGNSFVETILPTSFNSNNVFFNLNLPEGNYSAVVILNAHGTMASASVSFGVVVPQKISSGMNMNGAGPSQVTLDTSNNYTLSLSYANGTAFSLQDTEWVYNNLTLEIFNGIDPIQQATPLHYYAGIITFSVLFNETGAFTVYALSHAEIGGFYVEASAIIPSIVVSPAPIINNMKLSIVGTQSGTVGNSYNYSLFVAFTNGTSFTRKETGWVYANLSVQALNGTSLISETGYATGVIYFTIKYEKVSDYVLVAKSHVGIPEYANAQAVLSVIAEPKTAGIVSIQLTAEQQSVLNGVMQFTEALSGNLNASVMSYAFNNSVLTIYLANSQYVVVQPYAYAGTYIFFNDTFTQTGNYSAAVSLNINGQSLTAITSFEVLKLIKQSTGMAITIAGPHTIQINTTHTYVVAFMYSNGTLFNTRDTQLAYNNLTVELYLNNQFLAIIPTSILMAGEIAFSLNLSHLSQGYEVYASVSHTDLQSGNISASIPFSVASSLTSQTNPLGSLSFLVGIGDSIMHFLKTWGTYILTASGLLGLLWITIRLFRKKRATERLNADGMLTDIKRDVVRKSTLEGVNSLNSNELDVLAAVKSKKYEWDYFERELASEMEIGKHELTKRQKENGVIER